MEGRPGHYDAFRSDLVFSIPLLIWECEAQRRGPLLWSVIRNMQPSPTPSRARQYHQTTTLLQSLPTKMTRGAKRRKSFSSSFRRKTSSASDWKAKTLRKFGERFAKTSQTASKKISQKCIKNIKYLIEHYKEAKDWKSKQTRGSIWKTVLVAMKSTQFLDAEMWLE